MPDFTIEVHGVEELQRKMADLSPALRHELLNGMLRGMMRVEEVAKPYAPYKTGRLRASIASQASLLGSEIRGIIGSNVEYAPYQEFGTRYIAPRLYLTRALRESQEKVQGELQGAINKVVEEANR